MLISISRSWTTMPGSKAGPAFLAGGMLSVVFASLAVLINLDQNPGNPGGPFGSASELTVLGFSLGTYGLIISIHLALLVGLAAIYTRWATILDLLGKLGLWLAAGGFALVIIVSAINMLIYTLSFFFTGLFWSTM